MLTSEVPIARKATPRGCPVRRRTSEKMSRTPCSLWIESPMRGIQGKRSSTYGFIIMNYHVKIRVPLTRMPYVDLLKQLLVAFRTAERFVIMVIDRYFAMFYHDRVAYPQFNKCSTLPASTSSHETSFSAYSSIQDLILSKRPTKRQPRFELLKTRFPGCGIYY